MKIHLYKTSTLRITHQIKITYYKLRSSPWNHKNRKLIRKHFTSNPSKGLQTLRKPTWTFLKSPTAKSKEIHKLPHLSSFPLFEIKITCYTPGSFFSGHNHQLDHPHAEGHRPKNKIESNPDSHFLTWT